MKSSLKLSLLLIIDSKLLMFRAMREELRLKQEKMNYMMKGRTSRLDHLKKETAGESGGEKKTSSKLRYRLAHKKVSQVRKYFLF